MTTPEHPVPGRPVLNYHGGKWRLASWIIQHFPNHSRYVEPFGGAGSVLLRKARSAFELINDLDDEVVNLFAVLRDPAMARELERVLRLTPFARAEFLAAYEPTDDVVERARRLIIRSLMGFGPASCNPAFRTSFRASSRTRRLGYAGEWISYPDNILLYTDRLQGVVVDQRPAEDVIRAQDSEETLFYVDPPYPHETRHGAAPKRSYTHEMDNATHEALADCLHGTCGMVVLSSYPSELYERLYAGWKQVTRAAWADGARHRTEVLWLSPNAWKALQRMEAA
ncbi:DNA adenine methylase [Oceanidesulfovibrio marinus]|uniref:DNA adenine methylase n=1 Tax=Oceanidesulfovibrio marinus TaxID=370038 RepID=A0A6P1ZE24_9BACT|nr:DNA adenine methylase [Oceanidesulfovibrio marinus]TVM31761.1 DNA adenine methylase [Oceanidesulfovibrio marinus]